MVRAGGDGGGEGASAGWGPIGGFLLAVERSKLVWIKRDRLRKKSDHIASMA